MSTWYRFFPDNNDRKEVFIQAAGKKTPSSTNDWMANLLQVNWNSNSRHALLYWSNGTDVSRQPAVTIRQIVQLEQDQSGRYYYNREPVAKPLGANTQLQNDQYSLGMLNRQQRDRVLRLAESVPFNPRSQKNGCRVWLRDLLQLMVRDHIISQAVFEHICRDIPLPERQPE